MSGANRIPAIDAKPVSDMKNSGMELARGFFTPLGIHLRAALADLPDRDLLAAHRVFTAMIAAMSTFETELGTHQPNRQLRRRPQRAIAAEASLGIYETY